MQFPPKHPIKAFLIFFIPIYALLIGLGLAGLENTYDSLFRKMGDTFFGELGEKGIVRFIKDTDPTTNEIVTMAMLINKDKNIEAQQNGTSVRAAKITTNTWRMGYLPLALLIALILSTPIPWKRRLFSLLWGLLAISFFIYFRVWIHLKYFFFKKEWLEVVTPGPAGTKLLEWSYSLFVYNIIIGLIIPLVIWILVSFRKEDRKLLTGLLQPLRTSNNQTKKKEKKI